jgi:anti-sigma B factor antagonist
MNELDVELLKKAERYAARHGNSSIRFTTASLPPRLVVSIVGTLDTESSNDFLEILHAAKSIASKIGGLSVDLGEIQYVSSTGIGVLSTAMMECAKERVPFTLRCVPEKIRSLFELLGLWSYFQLDPDKSDCDA